MESWDDVADGRVVAVAEDAAGRIARRVAAGGADGDALLGGCIDDLRASGYLRLTIPRELGGLGGSALDACVAQEKVSRALGSAGLAANMHVQYIGASLVSGLWRREMLDAFLRRAAEQGYLINNCQAEAEMGSPARGGLPATTATRVDGVWRIRGRKQWSTASPFLTHYAVSATVRAPGMPEHLGQFLVTAGADGVRIDRTWRALAMRESASHDLVFEDVFVPDADVIRVSETGERFTPSGEVAPWHGLTFSATYVGVAVAARDWTLRFAATRVPTNLGKPIAELPGVRAKLGEIEALLFAARRLIFTTARDWVEGRGDRGETAAQIPLVKMHATNAAVRVTDLCMRVAGGVGVAETQPLERCFRDVRSGLIHPPLDDVALEGAARHALREYREDGARD
ncbi:MAG TPA: acyl-CoA dehydrogenase family protein [Dehalococcoidia bacterium]|nr:acyl-CoA dehydrogenase family protein [Dehalococcoidia bacterium]